MADIDGMMRKISALIDAADGQEASAKRYDAEGDKDHAAEFRRGAANFRAKAEELMGRYRLEEEDLIMQGSSGSAQPVYRVIDLTPVDSEFRYHYTSLWHYVGEHCGVMSVMRYESATRHYVAHAVGYDIDLRLAEILYNSARLMFMAKLEPDVDGKLSDRENIYRLRSAGIDRQRIAEMVWGKRGHQEGLRVGMLYKEACAMRGEDAVVSGRSINAKTYREVFAREFVGHLAYRLRQARDAADSAGGVLVLKNRHERVQEAFWTRFPDQRPKPEKEQPTANTTKPGKTKAVSKAQQARWQRMYYGPSAVRGTQAGQDAADAVHLDRVASAARIDDRSASAGELEG